MANIKKWSDEEVARLKQIMTRYSIDVEGCKVAAQELGRPYGGVYSKWLKIKPNKRTFSNKEELAKILYKNISKYPGNISKAMRISAEEANKSFGTMSALYYDKNSPYHYSKAATCFTIISKDKISSNKKNFNDAHRTTKQRIKSFIIRFLGITKEDL